MWSIVRHVFTLGLVATTLPAVSSYATSKSAKLRTVVTTDMEQDDLASLIRYLLYTNDLDTQGIIYSSSVWHWAGNGNGTSLRWTGTRTIEDIVLKAYAEVYPNLRCHDPSYPTPKELLSTVRIGNIDFEGEMDKDTAGSDLIKELLLDDDPRKLYLQAWGGTNTIARALKSIEDRYSKSRNWARIKETISRKAVIMASGFQDDTYVEYIAAHWPQIRVEELSAGYDLWAYNCNKGQGNVRGLPNDNLYFTGEWIRPNIEMGPYGRLYRAWLDGQSMPGDPEDIFGNATAAVTSWCNPLDPYDFLSEGDNVAFNPLLTTGLQEPTNPKLGGWGGRAKQNSTSPDLWVMAETEAGQNGTEVGLYTMSRWIAPIQNDFAARMQWTVKLKYSDGNHAPSVEILNVGSVKGYPGATVNLAGAVHDPDDDNVHTSWWQYLEEGTYPGTVAVAAQGKNRASVTIPADAKRGQTISIILEGTDDGLFPLTRYDRVFIKVL
ncbi:hypothetical protein PENANT_c001G08478 [Penicillium antarcticum]|uniref:DUF1593 domain-containing protein n=1 Tax=Penicillium antarcticum TaxID=416450 RepID=A0A1V6QMD0_9EURO|nr:uncharacterized protein N7508_010583 [Penicillium antarcticum]KAJ5295762.1 hypothetical protein N7508_010583 [Penicillium antarcticum]OQD90404.1 hypothetical protein PENANT_c001G08478 [Penicillium antarcticum]